MSKFSKRLFYEPLKGINFTLIDLDWFVFSEDYSKNFELIKSSQKKYREMEVEISKMSHTTKARLEELKIQYQRKEADLQFTILAHENVSEDHLSNTIRI